MHTRLARQLDEARLPDGGIDLARFTALVAGAYAEADAERERGDRSMRLRAEELEAFQQSLERKIRQRTAELRDSRRALKLQTERMALALDSTGYAISIFDGGRRLVYCNSYFLDLYHLPRRLGKPGTPFADIVRARIAANSFVGEDPERYYAERTQGVDRNQVWVDVHRLNSGEMVSVNHQPLPDGEQGEIWLGGPSKAEGYVNLPDETAESFSARIAGEGGLWLRTGDLGLVQDGFLYVTGRIKDMLIANGRKIGAAELEWLAAGADPALNPLAAAAFAPDPAQGAEAVLMIELKAGHQAPEAPEQTVRQRIERLVTGEWGITLRDLHILPRGRLARTSSGKVRRQVIAQAYRQGATPGGALAEATED